MDEHEKVELGDETILGPTDFGFIVSADGELKSIMIPENFEGDLPEEIVMILDILGIDITAPPSTRNLH